VTRISLNGASRSSDHDDTENAICYQRQFLHLNHVSSSQQELYIVLVRSNLTTPILLQSRPTKQNSLAAQMPPRIAYASQGRFDLLGMDDGAASASDSEHEDEQVLSPPTAQVVEEPVVSKKK
jgi:hypothetical protein